MVIPWIQKAGILNAIEYGISGKSGFKIHVEIPQTLFPGTFNS
jgi:hypothetical protein